MRGKKKYFLWTTGILGTFLVLLLLMILLLPYFITLEPVRQKIMAGISQRIDGQFVFQKVDFSFFPRPRISIQQAQILIPEKVSLAVKEITIVPQIIPLLQGKVRISLIKAEAPRITLELPSKPSEKEKSIPFSSAIIQEQLPSILKLLESEAPQLTVELENGWLDLRLEKRPFLWFQEIQGRITLPPDQLRIDLTSKSNLWEDISISAQIGGEDLNGTVNVQVTELNLQRLQNFLVPAIGFHIEGSRGNLKINLKINQAKTLHGKIQASLPSLTIQDGEKKSSLKGIAISGAFQTEGDKATISIAELSLQNPRARFGGEFFTDLSGPLFRLELSGREIDVFPLREILMKWFGTTNPAQMIFDIVREGRIPSISFKTHGRSAVELWRMNNISVQGSLMGGRIFLSESLTHLKDINFDLRQTSGEVLISQGILEGRNLAAQWEKAGVTKGLLRLGLAGDNPPFHLEAMADADLAQFPLFLKKMVRNQTFSEEINRIRNLQGRVRGKVTLGETLKSIQPRIDIQEMSLSALYDRTPYPVQVESVQGSYDTGKVAVQNLKGSVGQSSFKEISAQINLGDTPYLAVRSGKSSIAVGEIFVWLTSLERFKVHLQDIKSLDGVMTLSSMSMNGPLGQAEKWDYRLSGEIEKLTAEVSGMPGPLSISTGKFEANADQIILQDSQLNLSDTSLKISATANIQRQRLRGIEGAFEGNLGARFVDWASNRFQIPEDKRIRAPFSISQARAGWDRDSGISFTGNCQWPKGPLVFIDLRHTPEALTVNRVRIRDENSQADLGLKVHQKELDLDFKGNLGKATVDQILLKNGLLEGLIQGDFHAHITLDDLVRSTAQGKIAGTGFHLVLPMSVPLILRSFSLDVDRNKIHVQSADLYWEDRQVTLEGTVDFLPEAILLDVNVHTDGLQWGKIEKFLKSDDQKSLSSKTGQGPRKSESSSAKEIQFPPLRGRIGIKSPYFEYERYTWKPLKIEITFPSDEVRIAITEANVCGISTTGIAKVIPGSIGIDFHPFAEEQELSSSGACLLGKSYPVSGKFNLDGQFKGQGQPKDLIASLQGPWQIEAKDGRLYRESIIIHILGFLNLSELFEKDKRDPGKREMNFKTFQAKGDMQAGKVFIRELTMNTSGMTLFSQGEVDIVNRQIDLVVAIAPLKTVDWLISYMPIGGYVLGGTLVSIPVKVKGDLSDPRIIPFDPSEIGSEFLGGMKRVLKVPFKLIKPIFKDHEKKEK